ncbi:MAG: arylsulfatase A-like enzyme [Planctomycetota bacterium]|jgi:arylsulfatase A-like enzyme
MDIPAARLACLAASTLALVPLAICEQEAEEQPLNVVVILADDLGWMDLGCYGSSFYDTPSLDGLAAQGRRFTNAYAACPVCSPTRASLMTGRYPQRFFATDYFGASQPQTWKRNTPLLPAAYTPELPLEEVTMAETLGAAGYATFFAGKWHLGPKGHWPEDQGFDVNRGGIQRGGPYGGKRYFSPYGNERLEDGPEGEHLPARLAQEAIDFMGEHREDPFLVYLSFYSVHTPLMSRADLQAKYEARAETLEDTGPVWGKEGKRKSRLVQNHAVYAGMVEAMDEAVGNVLAAIDDLELRERTLVIFTSDNGGLSTSEGHPTSNLPLRAGKGWLYEGGIREPMIVRWPGVTSPGSLDATPLSSIDIFPTVLDAVGLEPDEEHALDGRSLRAPLAGEDFERGPLFWHYPHYGNQGGAPGGAVRDGDWKLIQWYGEHPLELYNLAQDPGEANNLASAQPERSAALLKQLEAWRTDVGARMPAPNPAY